MGKVYDGIIGVALGDALGVPVEFVSREDITKSPLTGMREYGTHNQPMGTWSDDTSLTLALMDSIVRKKGIDYYDIMDRFSEWLFHGAYGMAGIHIKKGLYRRIMLKAGKIIVNRMRKQLCR